MASITLSGFIRIDNPLIFSMENLSDKYQASTIKKKIAQIYTFTNDDYHIRVWASANFVDLENKAIGVFVTSSAYSRKGFYAITEKMPQRRSEFNAFQNSVMKYNTLSVNYH